MSEVAIIVSVIAGPLCVGLIIALLAAHHEIRSLRNQIQSLISTNTSQKEAAAQVVAEHEKLKASHSQLEREHLAATHKSIRGGEIKMPGEE